MEDSNKEKAWFEAHREEWTNKSESCDCFQPKLTLFDYCLISLMCTNSIYDDCNPNKKRDTTMLTFEDFLHFCIMNDLYFSFEKTDSPDKASLFFKKGDRKCCFEIDMYEWRTCKDIREELILSIIKRLDDIFGLPYDIFGGKI